MKLPQQLRLWRRRKSNPSERVMGKHRLGTGLFTVFALIVLYVLSIGPAAELVHKRYIPLWAMLIYQPMATVADYVPSVSPILNAYIEWWSPLDD